MGKRERLYNEPNSGTSEYERGRSALQTQRETTFQQRTTADTEMDKDLFSKTVKLIYAEEDGSLSFILKGDIEFRVNIAEENNGE